MKQLMKNELCNQKKLIRLALDSNEKSNVLFNHSQKNITKKDASRYVTKQHNLIIRSIKMGEDFSQIESISQSITTGK